MNTPRGYVFGEINRKRAQWRRKRSKSLAGAPAMGVAFISSADRNFWTGTLILVCQVELVAKRGGVLSIQGAHGTLLQAV